MAETYVELMIKRTTPAKDKFLFGLVAFLLGASAITFLLFGILLALIGIVIFGVLTYIVRMRTNLEYEYLYVDRELQIDKIMSMSRRKKLERINLDTLEVLAPVGSHHLDEFKNRTDKIKDYSSGEPDAQPYMIIYEGKHRTLIEPNEAMLKAIRNIAPRKVFMD